MKTLISLLTAGFVLTQLFVADVHAQERGAFLQNQGQHIAWLYADNVNLTEEQKVEIARIVSEHRVQLRAERRLGDRPGRFDRRTVRTGQQADISEAVKEILTAEQYAAYKENMQKATDNRVKAHSYVRIAQAKSIADEIGLSASEKAAVVEVVRQHVAENMENRGLRQGRIADIDTRIDQLKARRDFENRLKEIMTEDQFSAWSEAWAQHSPGLQLQRADRGQRAIRGDRQRRMHRN